MERINETEHAIYREKGIELDVLLDPSQHTVWLTQKQIAELFRTSRENITIRIGSIYKERQLNKVSTSNSKSRKVIENGREVTRNIIHYNLDVIKAIRGRNESDAADRFLAWADMLVKGIRNEIANFGGNNLSIDVLVSPDENTVWLTQDQISELFGTTRANVTMHIQNIFDSNELTRDSVCKDFLLTGADGKNYVTSVYNLDLILSIGYRVNSKRGIEFRRWANKVLKDYLIEGYAANEKRLKALNRVIEVQKVLMTGYIEKTGAVAKDVIAVLDRYTAALTLLDDYDHQTLAKPKKAVKPAIYLTEEECLGIIQITSFKERSSLFGKEKDPGLLKGILDQIAQYVFGVELYPSVEEKAAHLLYFLVKDHVFADGNKRIAALLYLAFLHKNGLLVREDGTLRIANDGLAALTILIAESRPDEMEIMVSVAMNMTGK